MTDVIILCGGRGSRMGELTQNTPKTLILVNGKPILWYIIKSMYQNGIRHFILPTGFKSELIREYIST